MKKFSSRDAVAATVVIASCVAATCFFASAQTSAVQTPLKISDDLSYAVSKQNLADKRIDESSGIAASRRFANYLWTHNDSGDSARAFLIAQNGDTLAEVSLRGAGALDWEDMAVAGDAKNSSVYIGDIGDNLEMRPAIAVYRFREKDVPLDLKSTPEKAVNSAAPKLKIACERQTLIYPDGAHNAEALMATSDGRLLIATKRTGSTVLFVTPAPFKAGARQTLREIGTIKIGSSGIPSRLVTGGALSPDGRRLILRSYTHAHEWTLAAPNSITGDWWKHAPRSFALPSARQGEAICYSADGRDLLLTSEKTPSPLWKLSPLRHQ